VEGKKAMEEKLTPISPGLYRDRKGALCLKWEEFLAAHGLPDGVEVRQAVREQIRLEFGVVAMKELD
jgi:hypothetical protein